MNKNYLNTDNLIKTKNGRINWQSSVGINNIECYYNGKVYKLNILSYNKQSEKVLIECDEYGTYEIPTTTLKKGSIGKLINSKQYKAIGSIGDSIINEKQHFEIIDIYKDNSRRFYSLKCIKCNHEFIKREDNILSKHGCPVCANKSVKRGFNDIATTHNYLCKYFVDIEDTYKYTYSSMKKVKMKCPICGEQKEMCPSDLFNQGFSCSKHKKNGYPEKFLYTLLKQTSYDFKQQLTRKNFEWCSSFRYDFYIYSLNTIIETHGGQHYGKGGFASLDGKSYDEIRKNDLIKKEIAILNGVKNYIEIDCSKSNMNFMKESIIRSGLLEVLNISNESIDWELCERESMNNIIYEICTLYNNGDNVKIISKKINKSETTVRYYLKQGNDIELCKYDGLENIRNANLNNNNGSFMQVLFVEKDMIFKSASELERKSVEVCGIKLLQPSISYACRHNKTYKGFNFRYI